jgi:hypothetical protein
MHSGRTRELRTLRILLGLLLLACPFVVLSIPLLREDRRDDLPGASLLFMVLFSLVAASPVTVGLGVHLLTPPTRRRGVQHWVLVAVLGLIGAIVLFIGTVVITAVVRTHVWHR